MVPTVEDVTVIASEFSLALITPGLLSSHTCVAVVVRVVGPVVDPGVVDGVEPGGVTVVVDDGVVVPSVTLLGVTVV